VIGANNDRAVIFKKEELQQKDINATTRRFHYTDVPDAAEYYLNNLGGKTRTDEWTYGGDFARHVAWLRETRNVVRGTRWLVEGDPGALAVKMLEANNNGLTADLYRWICGWLDNPKLLAVTDAKDLVFLRLNDDQTDNPELWINSDAPLKYWGSYVTGSKFDAPSENDLTEAIKSIAHEETNEKARKFKNRRFRKVRLDALWKWVEASGSFDVEYLKSKAFACVSSPVKIQEAA